MVRVDSDIQKIDKFFPVSIKNANHSSHNKIDTKIEVDETHEDKREERTDIDENKIKMKNTEEKISDINNSPNKIEQDRWKDIQFDQGNLSYIDPKQSFKTRQFKCERVETKLTSVKQLRVAIEDKVSNNLREILANLIFIACIDCHKSLIQHSTKLYLCDTTKMA